MNLFMTKAQRDRKEHEQRAQRFCVMVDFVVKLFDYSVGEDWITQLKAMAMELTERSDGSFWLKMASPYYMVYPSESEVFVAEMPFGSRTVPYAYLVKWWVDDKMMGDLVRIIVDNTGTALEYERGRIVIQTGAIDPRRFGDPGNRYNNACVFIKHFTGVELDWREHYGKTSRITVARQDGGGWMVEVDQLQPAS